MTWLVKISETAAKQLGKLDKPVATRIKLYLRERLSTLDDPRSTGQPLSGSRLGDLWRYRIGDYRIIASIEDAQLVILILQVGNRREVYR